MHMMMFFVFVMLIATIFIVSALYAHFSSGQYIAAWWAGIILAGIWIAYVYPAFHNLPQMTISDNYSEITRVDWNSLYRDTIRLNWVALCSGILVSIFTLELLYRIDIPERELEFNGFVSFLLLFLSFSSAAMVMYIFFIRDASHLFFSVILGIIEGVLLYFAFRGKGMRKIFGRSEA